MRREDRDTKQHGLAGQTHLACDGQAVGAVDALDDAPDVLDGRHERGELVVPEVREARDDARGDDEHICGRTGARVRSRAGGGGGRDAGDGRPGTSGLRLTMAAARRER